MEAIICTLVLVSWLLMLLGWFEFLGEVFITIIKKEFNSKDEAEEYFLTLKSLDYTLFLQEIFADG